MGPDNTPWMRLKGAAAVPTDVELLHYFAAVIRIYQESEKTAVETEDTLLDISHWASKWLHECYLPRVEGNSKRLRAAKPSETGG